MNAWVIALCLDHAMVELDIRWIDADEVGDVKVILTYTYGISSIRRSFGLGDNPRRKYPSACLRHLRSDHAERCLAKPLLIVSRPPMRLLTMSAEAVARSSAWVARAERKARRLGLNPDAPSSTRVNAGASTRTHGTSGFTPRAHGSP